MYAATDKESIQRKKQILKNHLDQDARRLKKDAHLTAAHARDDISAVAHAMGKHVRDFVESAGENISSARETISDATGTVTAQIRENPLPASAIALGVGVLLGAFFFRR